MFVLAFWWGWLEGPRQTDEETCSLGTHDSQSLEEKNHLKPASWQKGFLQHLPVQLGIVLLLLLVLILLLLLLLFLLFLRVPLSLGFFPSVAVLIVPTAVELPGWAWIY